MTLARRCTHSFLFCLGAGIGILNKTRAQQTVTIRIADAATGEALPAATLRFVGTAEGAVSGLNGRATLTIPAGATAVQCSFVGFLPQTLPLPAVHTDTLFFRLEETMGNAITEVVVKPSYEKIRQLMRAAITARAAHDPEKLPYYRCAVYAKVVADADFLYLADAAADTARCALRKPSTSWRLKRTPAAPTVVAASCRKM